MRTQKEIEIVCEQLTDFLQHKTFVATPSSATTKTPTRRNNDTMATLKESVHPLPDPRLEAKQNNSIWSLVDNEMRTTRMGGGGGGGLPASVPTATFAY